MKNKLVKILNAFLDIVLILVLAANLYKVTMQNVYNVKMPMLFDVGSAVVMSGSMEPELSPDDLIYVKKYQNYNKGDIITYEDTDGKLITHRIVGKAENGVYKTQGDSNNTLDEDTVYESQICGKVVLSVPKVGHLIRFARTPSGILLSILFVLAFLSLGSYLVNRKRPEKNHWLKKLFLKIKNSRNKRKIDLDKMEEEISILEKELEKRGK